MRAKKITVMTKMLTLALLFVLLASSTLTMSGCNQAAAKENVDLVNGVPPVNRLTSDQYATLRDLEKLKPEEIAPFLAKNWPSLPADIENYLRHSRSLKPSDTVAPPIRFLYVSDSTMASGKDSAGVNHTGHFAKQLIAKISFKHQAKPRYFFVQCTNGMSFELGAKKYDEFSMPDVVITISQKNENMWEHLGHTAALTYGRKVGLPIFAVDKRGRKRKISYNQALHLSPNTSIARVVIPVHIGDVCNITRGTYYCPHKKQ